MGFSHTETVTTVKIIFYYINVEDGKFCGSNVVNTSESLYVQ